MLQKDVEEKVCKALSILFEKDCYLLKVDANERSITHRLGIYMQEEFPEWDVDCEYNRDGHKIKELDGRVFPDIIVHKRGTHCNLLVVEVKKNHTWSDDDDRDKLRKFREDERLGYKHALFLNLGVGDEIGYCCKEWF